MNPELKQKNIILELIFAFASEIISYSELLKKLEPISKIITKIISTSKIKKLQSAN